MSVPLVHTPFNNTIHTPPSNATSQAYFRQSPPHVVIFQSGTMNQGAHTIEYHPQGSGNNVVLAFESYHACLHFAESLAEQHFVDPEPLEFDTDKLEAYFDRLGVAVQVIPRGVEVKPPTKNVPRTLGMSL